MTKTTLTRSQLLDKVQPRFEWVDIEGFGRVGIREVSEYQVWRRLFTYSDAKSGQIVAEEQAKATIHAIIDQIMVDEQTPMFTDDDFDELAAGSNGKLAPILAALKEFNGEAEKND